MGLKLYVDRMSQPSRAILIFCKMNKIDFEEVRIDLAKGQHRSPEFKEINPMGQVPAIVDGGFSLFESHAILTYLACVYPGVSDHWYPADLYSRAKINSVLDWHHSNLRRGAVFRRRIRGSMEFEAAAAQKIKIGICVMEKKVKCGLEVFSAPMGQILDRLQAFGEFELSSYAIRDAEEYKHFCDRLQDQRPSDEVIGTVVACTSALGSQTGL